MLVLSRQAGEKIHVGDAVITVVFVRNGKVRLAIDAPAGVPIRRAELGERGEATWPEGAQTGLGRLIEDQGPPSDQFPVCSWGGES